MVMMLMLMFFLTLLLVTPLLSSPLLLLFIFTFLPIWWVFLSLSSYIFAFWPFLVTHLLPLLLLSSSLLLLLLSSFRIFGLLVSFFVFSQYIFSLFLCFDWEKITENNWGSMELGQHGEAWNWGSMGPLQQTWMGFPCGSMGRTWMRCPCGGMGRTWMECPCGSLGWSGGPCGRLGWNVLAADLDGIPLWWHGADLDGMIFVIFNSSKLTCPYQCRICECWIFDALPPKCIATSSGKMVFAIFGFISIELDFHYIL